MNRVLKARIIEHFGTQADFSRAAKMRESTISRIIHGRDNLSYSQQCEWAEVLHTPAEKLFKVSL